MMSMSFDPLRYLSTIDHKNRYHAQRLSGGVVNITFRAVKLAPAARSSEAGTNNAARRIRDHDTFILKHAPPYIAGIGESAPLTTHRQTIEARALALFDGPGPLGISQFTQGLPVSLPRLLDYDEQQHVLVLSDLGSMPNLSDLFSDLGGVSPGEHAPDTAYSALQGVTYMGRPPLSSIPISTFFQIGQAIGTFVARLHSPKTLERILQHHDPNHFVNDSLRQTVLEHAVLPIFGQLKLFPDLLSAHEAETLGSAVVADFVRPLQGSEKSLVIGDCWTGTILINLSHAFGLANIGIIDWEFASISRGPHGDMSQFLAHLEQLRIAAEYQQRPYHLHSVEELIRSVVLAYSSSFQCGRLLADLRLNTMRSAMLSHGAEIINNAFWKDWKCEAPSCALRQNGHDGELQKCALVRQMVTRGVWFLRMADESVASFKDNLGTGVEHEWAKQKATGRYWLLDLFK